MHDYNTILGVIELRLSKVSYDSVQKRYRIGRSGIALIMNRYKDSGERFYRLRYFCFSNFSFLRLYKYRRTPMYSSAILSSFSCDSNFSIFSCK